MSVQIQKHYFSVGEYYQMARAGILSEDARVELIEGEVIETSPIGTRHAACVDRLNAFLNRSLGSKAIVRVQSSIRLNDFSEPQPDITLLKPRPDFYSSSHPTPSDALLIIEVADTSVEYDRRAKLPLYVRAGIPETWLTVLLKDTSEIHSQPVNGKYQKIQRVRRGRTITTSTISELSFKVYELLD
ncbi:MAG TPA: Uma2 family endonuclease [Blastocatellia bacterium]|nr:Uma2 family endonuclease [Blastocatellia bacterium]